MISGRFIPFNLKCVAHIVVLVACVYVTAAVFVDDLTVFHIVKMIYIYSYGHLCHLYILFGWSPLSENIFITIRFSPNGNSVSFFCAIPDFTLIPTAFKLYSSIGSVVKQMADGIVDAMAEAQSITLLNGFWCHQMIWRMRTHEIICLCQFRTQNSVFHSPMLNAYVNARLERV